MENNHHPLLLSLTKPSDLAFSNMITINTLYDQVAQGAKLRGASRIIGVDTNPEKSEKGILCKTDCSFVFWDFPLQVTRMQWT